jgi:arylsulfatase A
MLSSGLSVAIQPSGQPAVDKPNVVLIVADNLGYGDVGSFGSTLHRTPNLDRMADEGVKLTSFYATSGVCTPSRASLMTGSYPRRVNLHEDSRGGAVLRPVEPIGLHPSELTIAAMLKEQGYATTIIGKWHLGDQEPFLPTRFGFDSYVGIPYSDDMTPNRTPRGRQGWPPLPLMRDDVVIEAPVDRRLLTKRYTEEAIRFMTAHQDEPFFIYLPHAMPGSTRSPFASDAFQGKSANGPWGDAVEELDWSMGEILKTLRALHLDETTLVIWTSDNGAPQRDPPQGSNAPLAGWGYTTAEGGMRVPCIVRWPGKVPAGKVSDELLTMMDFLPTVVYLAGGQLPQDRIIDGRNVWPVLSGQPGATSPHRAFYYYQGSELQAVRSGKWKLYVPLPEENDSRQLTPARLYDVKHDLGETADIAANHPDVVRRLMAFADEAREELGDRARHGRHQRPAGWVADPTPRVIPEDN